MKEHTHDSQGHCYEGCMKDNKWEEKFAPKWKLDEEANKDTGWEKEAYKLCLHNYCEGDTCENVKLVQEVYRQARQEEKERQTQIRDKLLLEFSKQKLEDIEEARQEGKEEGINERKQKNILSSGIKQGKKQALEDIKSEIERATEFHFDHEIVCTCLDQIKEFINKK